jgi:hypothetical protein
VQKRLALPVGQIGIHPMREEDFEHLQIFHNVSAASCEHRGHADSGLQQAHHQVALAKRADRGEDSSSSAIG